MGNAVTWLQMTWVLAVLAGMGLVLFRVNRADNNKITLAQTAAENRLAAAIEGLNNAIAALERDTLRNRAPNSYVKDVEARLIERVERLEDRVNAMRVGE